VAVVLCIFKYKTIYNKVKVYIYIKSKLKRNIQLLKVNQDNNENATK